MRTHTNDRLQGTLDLLVLKTLASQGRMHGYALTIRIGASENNRRARYYSITAAGRRQLAEEEENWAQLTEAVARVLRFV
jgi:PadR family transcriptional regulator, regulatory protein PadR